MVRIGSAASTLLLLAALPFSSALKFDLHAHTGHSNKYERCIRNFVAKDTLVLVTAIVSGQKGDGQMVNMHIKDAVGNEYGKPKDIAGETRMAFASHADAAFDVCFENQLTAAGTVMNPSKHIELDIDIGADARDWSAIQAQEKLKPVETELRRIEELVSEVVAEMDYLRTREQKLRDTNESTNERVKWFAFGTMGMLVGLGAWQVVYLRAYFRPVTAALLTIDSSLVSRPTVDIYVGPGRELFKLHRVMLINRSPYFDSQLAAGVKGLTYPAVTSDTFREFVMWLFNHRLETPTTTLGIQQCISLNKFARTVRMDELANQTMDGIRSYCLSNQMVSTEVVEFLYAHTAHIKLRVLFCFELVLQARHNYIRMGTLIDASLTRLLEHRGRFAVDFAKLLAHCTSNRITWIPGRTFQKEFDCLFHTYLHSTECNVNVAPRNQCAETKIREAFQCID
ncbi:MAG: hypothetical protein Q9199_007621 [Rusavskia elegans]